MNALLQYQPDYDLLMSKDIRFHPDLTAGEKMFYSEIKSINKKIGNCPFSSKKLGQFFGVSHQTILTWVHKLVELDLLEVGIDYNNQECQKFIIVKNKK